MYYLFYSQHSDKMIQLTFADNQVTTHTGWEQNEIPTEFKDRYLHSKWSTRNEWLSSKRYKLLATSTEPITSTTHPEFLI